MTTPDPTPALLSTARLAEIRTIATAAPADLYAEPDPGATCDECGEYIGGEGAAILRTPGGGGELIVLSGDNDAATLAFHREARAMALELLAHLDALTPRDREQGGRLVRNVWIAWAKEQPAPKASWLVEWDGLSEPDREVDRRIFEACYAAGRASLTPRAPVDGEALGRRLYIEINPGGEQAWPHYAESFRERYITAALALHATGYAARASEGEAERAGLRRCRDEAQARYADLLSNSERVEREETIAKLRFDLARSRDDLTAVRDEFAEARADRDATIARLTAELAEARAAIASAANGSIDDIEAARRFGYHERDAEVAAARLDGAREGYEEAREQAACEAEQALIEYSEIDVLDSMPEKDRIARRIRRLERARAIEGRQG